MFGATHPIATRDPVCSRKCRTAKPICAFSRQVPILQHAHTYACGQHTAPHCHHDIIQTSSGYYNALANEQQPSQSSNTKNVGREQQSGRCDGHITSCDHSKAAFCCTLNIPRNLKMTDTDTHKHKHTCMQALNIRTRVRSSRP